MLRKLIALSCLLALPAFAQDALPWLSVMDVEAVELAISVVSSNHNAGATAPSTWTTTGANIGEDASDRQIVLCVTWRTAYGGVYLDTVTVGGKTATELILHAYGPSPAFYCGVYLVGGLSGETADIALSGSQESQWMNWVAYRLTGAATNASDTAGQDGATSTNITVAAGGVIVGCGGSASTGPSATMTGIDEDYDVLTDANDDTASTGHHISESGEVDRTVRINMGSATYDSAAFVAIDPAE